MNQVSHPVGSSSAVEAPANRFYRTVWRWHFYAGLFVIPFMIILAISGGIYLFKPQLDTVMYHNQIFVQPAGAMLPYSQQVAAAQQLYPDAKVSKLTPNLAADRSTEVGITTANQQNLTVFVNPYTAKVLGQRDEDNNLQAYTRKLHNGMMIGPIGNYLMELAACWGLVLLLSGLYLWLPRNGFSIWGTLLPRFWSRNKRIIWRDLHAVSGFYGVLLVAFLILTGLPWSTFWGKSFAQVWNQYPAHMLDNFPKSTALTGSLNQKSTQVVPWAVEQLPMPQSNPPGHQHPAQTRNSGAANSSGAAHAGIPTGTPVNLDSVIALAQSQNAPAGYTVSLPEDKTGVYTISAFPDDPGQEMTMHLDQYSGKVLADVRWRDYTLVPKAVEMGISIHMGKYFGFANQLVMLLACVIVVLLCVSGIVMWWLRRPTDRLGAPALPAFVQHWRLPLAIVVVLGIAFPLVGLSLVAVLLFDYLILSRIPTLKRLFN
jgi:uncharacterized iron-regulated membrane protein